MLTHEKLVDLYRELRQERVLSVYLDVDQHDPAERTKWRVTLEQELTRARRSLDGDDGELRRFESAWGRLRERLDGFESFLPERGWVGFATPERVVYAEHVPVPMPNGVYWEDGIRVAPYVRGLKQERPVVVALVDSQRGRVFRYVAGQVNELVDVRADTFMGDLTDVNVSKRASHRSGVRGETATDQAQSAMDVYSEHMLKHLVDVVTPILGAHGFLVVGGVTEVVPRAMHAFPKHLHSRVAHPSSLHLEMTVAEVKEAAEREASALTRRHQEELLAQVLEAAGAGGRACLGKKDTRRALEEMRVDTLLLSRTFIREQPDFADHCVGAAFAQGAAVEELSNEQATTLDDAGGGIGARLRYLVRANGGGPAEEGPAGNEGGSTV